MTATATAPLTSPISPQLRSNEGRLVVSGPDHPGIVAAVSAVLGKLGANIVSLDQYSSENGRFFQRTVFELEHLSVRRPDLEQALDQDIRTALGLDWTLSEAAQRKRVAIFASKTDHCLLDLLWRQRRNEIDASIEMVISNHPDLAADVRSFGIPYFHVPIKNGDKASAEAEHLRLLQGNVDLVVLARYMQIISSSFIDEVGVPIINIHHSFLPAFIGAGPYRKAKERGVKLIGATAHYVTKDLDEGPIIEQDVVRVSHAHTVEQLMRRGADVERQVLARAVAWHVEDRIVQEGNSTVVFAS